MFLKNVFKFVFKLERNYMYFLLQAWQILLHLREYAGFYVLQHRLRRNGNSSKSVDWMVIKIYFQKVPKTIFNTFGSRFGFSTTENPNNQI